MKKKSKKLNLEGVVCPVLRQLENNLIIETTTKILFLRKISEKIKKQLDNNEKLYFFLNKEHKIVYLFQAN